MPKAKPTVFEVVDLDTLTKAEKAAFTATTPLFVLGGVTYNARTTFTAGERLEYARRWRQESLDDAAAYAITVACGPEAWDALMTHPALKPSVAIALIEQVTDRLRSVSADA